MSQEVIFLDHGNKNIIGRLASCLVCYNKTVMVRWFLFALTISVAQAHTRSS